MRSRPASTARAGATLMAASDSGAVVRMTALCKSKRRQLGRTLSFATDVTRVNLPSGESNRVIKSPRPFHSVPPSGATVLPSCKNRHVNAQREQHHVKRFAHDELERLIGLMSRSDRVFVDQIPTQSFATVNNYFSGTAGTSEASATPSLSAPLRDPEGLRVEL
jgi:hypothetical protein